MMDIESDSSMDMDTQIGASGSHTLHTSATKKKTAAIAKKYVKLDQREHVLQKSGMYIGSITVDPMEMWVLDEAGVRMEKRVLNYIPGLLKIFNEIVGNAVDHYFRQAASASASSKPVKNIKVTIDKETGVIEIFNDGDGIEIIEHPEHKIFVPQLIFGNLLTSTNYDESAERTIQGTNGIGCKACNIFSEWMLVKTADGAHSYSQRFEKNMSVVGKPKVTKASKMAQFTSVTFLPDYARFGLPNGLSADMYEIMRKSVYDICAVTDKNLTVHFNGIKLNAVAPNFERYADLYLGSAKEHVRVYDKIGGSDWEVVASYNDFGGFEQISFVNGLLTIRGGKHVEYVVNDIVKRITAIIVSKNKDAKVRPQTIKDNMIIFIKCTVVNPTFDAQTKETLTTAMSNFKDVGGVSDAFITKLLKTGMDKRILEIAAIHDNKTLKKTDGKKSNMVRGVPKLEDAIWAGGAKSDQCVLILTEGDSAASMALAGISEVGRERYGVFPLKGKVMNVKDTVVKKIADNDEITNIKKILGLEAGMVYDGASDRKQKLRYGSIMLMTDSDVDGSHIKGLVFNLFHSLWPSLMSDKFLTSMLTPIIKARNKDKVLQFYNLTDYDNWKGTNPVGWKIKYYKGLGTSTNQEAKEYFKDMRMVTYNFTGEASDEGMYLAFDKKKADDRKKWLAGYDKQRILDYKTTEVTYEDFVNKELIHFSNYDLERSLPNMCDGLKISQRKIMFSCFKRNLTTDEIRVAQLAGYVSENSAYHHGEASLQAAIVGLAQNYTGSNNVNLLMPNGQFGSRMHGGKDASQPRYIHTLLSPAASAVFMKEDAEVLTYVDDDGILVEPEHYMPIIPMLLVNGAIGIGTGFSTNIPCYNPADIIAVIRELLAGNDVTTASELGALVPWYRGFKGVILQASPTKYISKGTFVRLPGVAGKTQVRITELPVGTWTFDYKEELEALLDKIPDFKKYENKSSEDIDIVLHFTEDGLQDMLSVDDASGLTKLENTFKLVSSKWLTTSNMYAFNSKGQITKYTTPLEIIKEHYELRLEFYQKRKDHMLGKYGDSAKFLGNKRRFIQLVATEAIKVHKMKKDELEAYLESNEFDLHNDSYDYIIRIPVYNLTKDKVDELDQEIASLKKTITLLKGKTIESMWGDDLDVFEQKTQPEKQKAKAPAKAKAKASVVVKSK